MNLEKCKIISPVYSSLENFYKLKIYDEELNFSNINDLIYYLKFFKSKYETKEYGEKINIMINFNNYNILSINEFINFIP